MNDFITQIGTLISTNAWAGLGGLIMSVFVTILTDRTHWFPSWDSPLRTFLGSISGTVGLGLNQAQNGNSSTAILTGVLFTSMPTLMAEFVAIWTKSKSTPSSGGPVKALIGSIRPSASKRPPPNVAALLSLVRMRVAMAACVLMAVVMVACGGTVQKIVSELPTVIADVQETQSLLEVLHAAAEVFLATSPNPATQATIEKGYAEVQLGLAALNDAAVAADDGAKGKLDEAKANAQHAYEVFEQLLRGFGVIKGDGKVAVIRGGAVERIEIRTPRLMASRK